MKSGEIRVTATDEAGGDFWSFLRDDISDARCLAVHVHPAYQFHYEPSKGLKFAIGCTKGDRTLSAGDRQEQS